MYSNMILGNTFDNIFYDAQRQGRISFYMTNFGEEGCQIATAEGLDPEDLIYTQYRELGIFIHRGVPLQQLADCNYSNMGDPNQGKQMPVHYGSLEKNIATVSSTLATQIPQAAGAAYGFKRKKPNNCVACFFGEGAASEGDAHAGFCFSASLKTPIIWICRNNGYAISTHCSDQYGGDGIIRRGLAMGMGGIRCDGNDILAVRDCMRKAREYTIREQNPIVVEFMTYRGGHHSTSDDATRYRDPEEIVYWAKIDNPIVRTKKLLLDLEYITESEDKEIKENTRKTVLEHFRAAEKKAKPPIRSLFEGVYKEKTWNLEEQEQHLFEHLKKYPQDYGVEEFDQGFDPKRNSL